MKFNPVTHKIKIEIANRIAYYKAIAQNSYKQGEVKKHERMYNLISGLSEAMDIIVRLESTK